MPGESCSRLQEALRDVMYCWMLAEAYLPHPLLHADMRCSPSLAGQSLASIPLGASGIAAGGVDANKTPRVSVQAYLQLLQQHFAS